MKPQDIIKAIAGLDGLIPVYVTGTDVVCYFEVPKTTTIKTWDDFPPYLTSRDAIVPVIERQDEKIMRKFWIEFTNRNPIPITMYRSVHWTFILTATPTQLCEALLRATGKFVEEVD